MLSTLRQVQHPVLTTFGINTCEKTGGEGRGGASLRITSFSEEERR
jgi:hypothetical protein